MNTAQISTDGTHQIVYTLGFKHSKDFWKVTEKG
jgi:hypothetical protein